MQNYHVPTPPHCPGLGGENRTVRGHRNVSVLCTTNTLGVSMHNPAKTNLMRGLDGPFKCLHIMSTIHTMISTKVCTAEFQLVLKPAMKDNNMSTAETARSSPAVQEIQANGNSNSYLLGTKLSRRNSTHFAYGTAPRKTRSPGPRKV